MNITFCYTFTLISIFYIPNANPEVENEVPTAGTIWGVNLLTRQSREFGS